MNKIKLELTLEETNKVLESLSNMPYRDVFGLIDNIRAQAAPQIPESEKKELPAQK